MIRPAWGRGYFEDCRYTCGFYRETAPNWLDFCSVIRGIRPPREFGKQFSYLELGSGMGFNLCLLAAAYPEGSFVGVDFNADQIAHSKSLAKRLDLDNISFIEADFTELSKGDFPCTADLNPQRFDYVTLHGILTWVTPAVQKALITCVRKYAKHGSLVYCSYNTNPGWQAGAIFRQIAEYERRREARSTPDKAYKRAAQQLSALLTYENEQPSSLARQTPAIHALIAEVNQQSPHYLLHEYANEGWHPLYVDEAHSLLASAQIHFTGSANPSELLPDLIPANIRMILDQEPDQTGRELLYDIATSRRFRRDIFTRGRCPLTIAERTKRLQSFMFMDARIGDETIKPLQTDFGEVSADPQTLQTVFEHLSGNSCTLKALSKNLNQPLDHTAGLMSMLLSQSAVGIASAPIQALNTKTETHNIRLAELISDGSPYAYFAAPGMGSAVNIGVEQAEAVLSYRGKPDHPVADSLQSLLPLLKRAACLT